MWCLRFASVLCSALAASPNLQPLLRFKNGTAVVTKGAWLERRQEVSELLQESILGTFPSSTPPLLSARTLLQHGTTACTPRSQRKPYELVVRTFRRLL